MMSEPSAFEVGMVAGLRTELAAARAQLAEAQAAVTTWRECAEARAAAAELQRAGRYAAKERISALTTERQQLYDLIAELTAERDAWMHDVQRLDPGRFVPPIPYVSDTHVPRCVTDATSPGPALVAETRAALPVPAMPACGLPPWFDEANAELDAHLATEADDPQPAQQNPVDVVVNLLGKRMVAEPDKQRLGRALDAANAPAAGDDRAAQDQALGRAIGGRHWPP
jgi:hypothetical protein